MSQVISLPKASQTWLRVLVSRSPSSSPQEGEKLRPYPGKSLLDWAKSPRGLGGDMVLPSALKVMIPVGVGLFLTGVETLRTSKQTHVFEYPKAFFTSFEPYFYETSA